ncbi:hypothetical protein [Fictibacillus sp. KU28468]|uniref:hypothetical protein n=1 Tax=Fictibacillus sp. KU28468 TaxID=2991053 RepID=UPI00223E48AD|nr:hypothetical protein [Fictibacillus sp. KU28468]UZJ78295.1 hypothetical protein OKX00_19435 [Fictibacillus sp. KU28468]
MVISIYNYELIIEDKRIFIGDANALLSFVSVEDHFNIGQKIKIEGNNYLVRRGELKNSKNQKNQLRYYLEASE